MSNISSWFPYEWRPYQKESFNAISTAYKEGITEQLVVQATGLGKRSQAVQISKVPIFHNKPSLFIAHREELINQAIHDFEKAHSYMDVGIIKGTQFEIDKKIVVASPQTLANRLDRINPDHFGLIQIDEAHNYMAKSFLKAVRHFNHTLRIGWTATPYRLDGLSLSNLFEKIVFEYNIDEGVKDGYLCELDAIRVKTNLDLSRVHKSMGDFNQTELEETIDTPERNKLIVQKYLEYAENRQFVAFTVTIKHAHNLANRFKERGLAVEVISSESTNRSEIEKAFREKKLVGLVNVNILTEGWDYPNLGCVIDAAPTTSLTRYLQRIGRGTRLKNEEFINLFGQKCIILDIIDNTGKHNVVNTWELDKGKSAVEKIFVSKEKREKLIDAENERKFKARVLDNDTRVNLLRLPKVTISGSPKMLEMATDKQIAFLKRLGIFVEGIEYTKALASEAISNNNAENWQLKKLKEWGYDISNGATIGQYQKIWQSKVKEDQFKIPEKEINAIINKL